MDTQHKIGLGLVAVLVVGGILFLMNPFAESSIERGENTGITVGATAPDFTLATPDGDAISLSDFKGEKAVVLNFWATWCPFCVDEMPFFQDAMDQHSDSIVLGVNLQEKGETAKKFADELGVTYPILLDPNSDVTNAFNVRAQPTTYFINKNGVIVDKRAGPLSEEEIPEKFAELVASVVAPKQASFSNPEIMTLPDGTPYIIHPNDLLGGGPPKDGIPSIDDPKFISASEVDFIGDDELVVGVELNGEVKAYPFQILVWHEIVNDFFGEQPVLITYCPLCGTAIAFDRTIEGEAVEFGTSGMLYNSNLVMYDRKTDSLWNQVGARAIIGELTGSRLKLLPSNTVTWREWRELHPDSQVLTRDTGATRSYGVDPYGSYYTSRGLYFPVDEEDERLHQKAVIYGVELDGIFKAYPDEKLKKGETLQDTVAGATLSVTKTEAGTVEIVTATGEMIPFERHFWFSWFAFHPDTELY